MEYNSIQIQRLRIMRAIACEMAVENVVLKGGTALLLCYGLDRFSEDMDFDGTVQFNFARVKKIIQKAFEKHKTRIKQIIVKKDTPTTKRLMLHYDVSGSPDYAYPLKIEFSFRQAAEISDVDVEILNGIRVYKIEKLVEKKLNAFFDRMTPRDIYDTVFLLKNYPNAFSKKKLQDILYLDQYDVLNAFENNKLDDFLLEHVDGITLIYELFSEAETLLIEVEKTIKKNDFEMG